MVEDRVLGVGKVLGMCRTVDLAPGDRHLLLPWAGKHVPRVRQDHDQQKPQSRQRHDHKRYYLVEFEANSHTHHWKSYKL